ncbi:MAG: ABC transporter substrate-binding protein [Nitrospinota bacterium]
MGVKNIKNKKPGIVNEKQLNIKGGKGYLKQILFIFLVFQIGCSIDHPLNNPYSPDESEQNILYSSFSERPKHLDPARSYSSNEYAFIGQIYEPPFQYHYLKRPYELIPLTAVEIPAPIYYDKEGNRLPPNPPEEQVARAIYEIKIRPGIRYQEHPAFAKNSEVGYLYHNLTDRDMESIYELKNFKQTGSRELVAKDYIYQIKRMANPQLHSPVFPIIASYIFGFAEYSGTLNQQLKKIRAERKAMAGAIYNQELEEQQNPIVLDLDAYPLPGVEEIDRYTYRITLKAKYPQFIYWMAMPFFAPMPWEAEVFYGQGPLLKRQISLDWYPIGTGPYRLEVNNPNKEIILVQNENFHGEFYPSGGFPGAKKMGLLTDAGKPLPFIPRAVFKLEKEDIPYWNKFLQGYYDTSGIPSDSFDQAINIGPKGDADLTEKMKAKNIRLSTSIRPSTYYMGFNMLDDVVGGYSKEKKKLRQAISIAIDYEEYIQIFLNGRGIPARSPLPPGIFGYQEGEEGINPFVYNWTKNKQARKSIAEAKQLLKEAGYPGGKDAKTGKPLLLYFDTTASGPDAKSLLDWLRKQFKKIDIQLVVRPTDYNRFQDKMLKGNAQIFQWGWNADYPDPENFLFLLYGPNKKVGNNGENAANYENQVFDALFEKMANMESGPDRLKIIKEMLRIIQEDAPWVWGFHPISYGLYHSWYQNAYPNMIANNTLKYKRVDPVQRKKSRREWNQPVVWPLILVFSLVIISAAPAAVRVYRRERTD